VTKAAGPRFGTLSSRMLGYTLYLREHFNSPGYVKARSLSDFPRIYIQYEGDSKSSGNVISSPAPEVDEADKLVCLLAEHLLRTSAKFH
jgi:hypothetical protein